MRAAVLYTAGPWFESRLPYHLLRAGVARRVMLDLLWGIVTGVGTGAVTNVLGATIALRWFRTHRALIVGAFASASSATLLGFAAVAMPLRISTGGAARPAEVAATA